MAKKIAGVDVLLKVKDSAGVKQIVGGQTNCTLNREAETISVTDKTSGGFTSSIAGLISWSVDCDGFVVLGDSAFDLIETAFMSRQSIDIEIRIGADSEADGVTYTGTGYIVDLPLEFSQDDAVTYALSVEGATALVKTKGTVVTPV
jgi:TP901-1 family phage major tail protein